MATDDDADGAEAARLNALAAAGTSACAGVSSAKPMTAAPSQARRSTVDTSLLDIAPYFVLYGFR
ncbi:MAG: hypothetical protein WBF58_20350 [Xanthobacteraceae bacterium]